MADGLPRLEAYYANGKIHHCLTFVPEENIAYSVLTRVTEPDYGESTYWYIPLTWEII